MKKRNKIITLIITLAIISGVGLISIGNVQGLRGSALANSMPDSLRKAIKYNILLIKDAPSLIATAFNKKSLPTINLILDHKDIESLYTITSDDEYQTRGKIWRDAKIQFGTEEYAARVRLRGDTSPHWAYQKKSWRIKLKKNKSILGHNTLNLIVPQDRFYIMEWLNNERAKQMNLIVPNAQFVALTLNGKSMGPYVAFEHLDNAFIENHALPNNTVIFGEEGVNEPIFSNIGYWKIKAGDTSASFKPLSDLINIMDEPDDQIFYNKLSDIVDIENLAAWHAHSILAGSTHQDWAHNIRIYYSEEDNKLRFIPWDLLAEPLHRDNQIDRKYNPIFDRLVNIKEYQIARGKILWRLVANKQWQNKDAELFNAALSTMKAATFHDRSKEETNKSVQQTLSQYAQWRESNIQFIRTDLDEFKVYASMDWNINYSIAHVKVTTTSEAPHRISEWNLNTKQPTSFALYADNGDGAFNFQDKHIANSQANIIPSNTPQTDIMTNKVVSQPHELYTTFKNKPQTYSFFVKFNTPQSHTKLPTLSLILTNLITQKEHELNIKNVAF